MSRFLTCLAIISSVLILLSPAVQAQKLLGEYKIPLPEEKWEMPSQAEFEKETLLHEATPLGDSALSYRVRLPKDWTEPTDVGLSNYKLSNRLMGEIAQFFGPPKMYLRSRFTIEALGLNYQLTAEQWFLQHVMANGYTMQGMKTISDHRVEALFVLVQGDTTYVVRAVAEINGKRVVLAQYYLPSQYWNDEKIMQAQVMKSFALTKPDTEFVEKMQVYQFLDVAEFKYPTSWVIRADPVRSIDRMSVEVRNVVSKDHVVLKKDKDKPLQLNGKIEIALVSSFVVDDLESELDKFKKDLTKTGLILGDFIEDRDDFTYDDAVEFGSTKVYKAFDEQKTLLDYELWLTVMSSGSYYYFVTLLTPSRDASYFIWSRNTQTYKLITSLIEPQPESIIYGD